MRLFPLLVLPFLLASDPAVAQDSGASPPSLTASLRPGETITVERACGHISRVRVVDAKGQVIFELVEAPQSGRDC